MEKRDVRRTLLERRAAVPPDERARLDRAAQLALIGSEPFRQARLIMLYQAFRGEVATELIAGAAVAGGRGLALPRVQKDPRKLFLHQYSGDPATLVRGAYGICEPGSDWPLVEPAAVDLVVVPGLAFDRAGGRLGYGGGYYDRLLPEIRAANPGAVLVGLAYGFQLVDELPKGPHDMPVDALATDIGFATTRGDV
jgi:5-formyltetrahydrofolate cyclo-ligase